MKTKQKVIIRTKPTIVNKLKHAATTYTFVDSPSAEFIRPEYDTKHNKVRNNMIEQ